MSLKGKKVVVVGGSSGIGLATARMAKAAGADVVIASRNADKLKTAADKIGATSIVTSRSFLFSIVRVAIIPGMAQAKELSSGMNDFPWRPTLLISRSIMNAALAM